MKLSYPAQLPKSLFHLLGNLQKICLAHRGLSKTFHSRDTGMEVLVEVCLRTRKFVRNVHDFRVRGNVNASMGCGWDGIRKHFKEKIITNT